MTFYGVSLSVWSLVVRIFAPLFIFFRLKKSLEDPKRYKERYGISNHVRPEGDLIWLHGASVGESLSLLPLVQKILVQKPSTHILITTTTTAAQKVISSRVSLNVIHQFIPFDSIAWIDRFLNHWKPKAVFFVESEVWPNILRQLQLRHIPVSLLNARLSEKSTRNWCRIKNITKEVWKSFSCIYTQSDVFTKRFNEVGAENVRTLGNIKLLSKALPYDKVEFEYWKEQIGDRPCWVAASTHQGEEDIVFKIHKELKKDFPTLLTIIVPRHVERCNDLKVKNLKISKFSNHCLQDEDILIVDAMGKLGVFYSLCSVAFVGGSLVPVGGHNPLEPILLGAFPLWGPYFFNVADMMYLFEEVPCQHAKVDLLVETLKNLLKNPEAVANYVKKLQSCIVSNQKLIHQKVDEIINAA